MESMAVYFSMALTAAAVENAVFTRALGLNKFALLLNNRRHCLVNGLTITWMLVVCALPVSLINYWLLDLAFSRAIRTPLYLASIMAVYLLTHFGTARFFPALHKIILPALPVSTFNTALFGAMYISALQRFTFAQTSGYALGTGAGYTVALLVVYYARKRLAISPVPKAFKGLPVLLVYLGLLSLAIYGLTGHGLSV